MGARRMSRARACSELVAASLGCAWLLAMGCTNRQAEAPTSSHPPGDAIVVPYPPPPAKVEELPPMPSSDCIWTDGYWEFSDRWEWQPGEWVVPPPRCQLAPVELRRQAGQLWHARPRWYAAASNPGRPRSACPRPAPCRSATTDAGLATER